MILNYNDFLAVVYADLFDFALTGSEAAKWAIKINKHPLNKKNLKTKVESQEGLLFLPGRSNLVDLRGERTKISEIKFQIAHKATKIISSVPTVLAIFVTGSLAMQNADKKADIDLMVVTKDRSLWISRMLIVVLLKFFNLYRDKQHVSNRVCTNLFLSESMLRIKDQNVFTAHEVLQAQKMFDRTSIEKRWLAENAWTKDFLPNAYQENIARVGEIKMVSFLNKALGIFLMFFEPLAFFLQSNFMKKKMTNEKVSKDSAFFHPNKLSALVQFKFEAKIAEFSKGK